MTISSSSLRSGTRYRRGVAVRFAHILATTIAAASVGACFLGNGLDGFTGGQDASDGGSSDADTSRDGEGPRDGGVDAPLDDAAPTGPFCKVRGAGAAVCADFDESGGALADGFDEIISIASAGQTPTGAGTRDTSVFLSGPAALRVTVPPFASSPARWVAWFLRRAVTTPVSGTVHVELATRFDMIGPAPTAGASTDTEVFNVVFTAAPASYDASYVLTFAVHDGQTSLAESIRATGAYTEHLFVRKRITVGPWSRLALDVDFTAKTLRMTADGVDPFDGPRPMLAGATSGYVALEVGTPATYHTGGASLVLDDVLLRVGP